jgi:hypothetical protein
MRIDMATTYGTGTTSTGNFRFNPMTNEYEVYDGKTWTSVNQQRGISIQNHTMPIGVVGPADSAIKHSHDNKFEVHSTHGRFIIDLETGDLTMPAGVAKHDGLRQFWLAFQENFKGTYNKEYEQQIIKLKNEVNYFKDKISSINKNAENDIKNKLIDKVRNKYGSEKFIMTKPDELIKLLESE